MDRVGNYFNNYVDTGQAIPYYLLYRLAAGHNINRMFNTERVKMKNIILAAMFSSLIACGGVSEEQVNECEAQGGTVTPYLVENLITGEQMFHEQCELEQGLPKGCRYAICKLGSENCPIICD